MKTCPIEKMLLGLLAGALLTGLAVGRPAQALKPDGTANQKCLSCHTVDSLSASVHANLSCTDCHQIVSTGGTKELPHQKKKDIPPANCAAKCHRENHLLKPGESPVYYPDSVHGKAFLQRGVQDVAKCWDCHGKHNIKKVQNPESTVNRKNIPLICSRCHENMSVIVKYHIHAESPYQEYMQSVHGKAVFEKGLVSFAAVCTDCHGVHNIQGVGEPHLAAKNPETCGKCHSLIFDEYKQSIHGREALKGNFDAPVCVDCHGEHTVASPQDKQSPTSKARIPDTCSACHARPEIMKKYGVPEDRIKTFIESFHGIAIGFGDKAEANCSSCHGVHDIRPADDPLSKVNPANLAKTCGQAKCHPGMSEKIAKAKIHRDINEKKSGAPFYVQKVLLWVLLVVVALTGVWFIPELIRRAKRSKTK